MYMVYRLVHSLCIVGDRLFRITVYYCVFCFQYYKHVYNEKSFLKNTVSFLSFL